jgi:hypothetical protein
MNLDQRARLVDICVYLTLAITVISCPDICTE